VQRASMLGRSCTVLLLACAEKEQRSWVRRGRLRSGELYNEAETFHQVMQPTKASLTTAKRPLISANQFRSPLLSPSLSAQDSGLAALLPPATRFNHLRRKRRRRLTQWKALLHHHQLTNELQPRGALEL